jgi:hypothetical protein
MEDNHEYVKELARRLCAATLSCELRVSLQHAYKEGIKKQGGEIGPCWIALAKHVIEHRWENSAKDPNRTGA